MDSVDGPDEVAELTLTFRSLHASQLGSFRRWRYALFVAFRLDEEICVGETPAPERLDEELA